MDRQQRSAAGDVSGSIVDSKLISGVDWPALQREGLSHLGRYAARRDSLGRARASTERTGGEAQRRTRDAARVVGARQHADDLPEVVRASDRRCTIPG